MNRINDCENCHHFNTVINWSEGICYQCMIGNKLWEHCNDYDAIKNVDDFQQKVHDTLNEAIRECDNDATYETLIRVAWDLGVDLE